MLTFNRKHARRYSAASARWLALSADERAGEAGRVELLTMARAAKATGHRLIVATDANGGICIVKELR